MITVHPRPSVRPRDLGADLALTARVRRALTGAAVNVGAVHISSFGQRVRLAGHVPNEDERSRAAAATQGVAGVRDVINGLHVR